MRDVGERGFQAAVRETYFVLEGNAWRHRFTGDEYALFMPDASFQEFVEAQGG